MRVSNKAAGIVALVLAVAAPPSWAEDSFFDSLAKKAGLATTAPDPPDFVKATRPKTEPTSVPVFAVPDEPRSKVKSAAELKAMDADLERASSRQRGSVPRETKSVVRARSENERLRDEPSH